MTAANVIASLNYTTEAKFNSYQPVAIGKLKATTQKLLEKFWTNKLGNMNLEYKPGISVDAVGEDFLMEAGIFWQGAGYDDTITLGELLETREVELEDGHVQFEIIETRVDNILSNAEDGILRGVPLMQLPTMIQLPKSDQFITGSGRHRIVSGATIAQVFSGWEHFKVPVRIVRPKNAMEVALYISTSNGSRSMSKTEEAMIKGAAKGLNLSVFREPEEIFTDAIKNSKTVTDLKAFARSVFPALLRGTAIDGVTSINAMGDIGNSFINSFARSLNAAQTKSGNMLLECDESGVSVFETVCRKATQFMVDNWDTTIRGEFQEVKKDGQVDFNPSRKAPKIGGFVADLLFTQAQDRLLSFWNSIVSQQEASKSAKSSKKVASSLDKEIKAIETTLEQLRKQGITDATMLASFEASKAKLIAERDAAKAKAEVGATPAPAEAAVVNQPPTVDPNMMF